VTDNGSTDDTNAVLHAWAAENTVIIRILSELTPGLAHSHNRAVGIARGALFAFTDDDCRFSQTYVADLLRHDAADDQLVLRGGRVELGDPTDLPITITTDDTPIRWELSANSARHHCLSGKIHGCNITMRRTLFDRIGAWNEDFGPGARIGSGSDTDLIFRAYLAGVLVEYVPDMTVFHHHGRKTSAAGNSLFCRYMTANGALYAKYFFKHPNLCRPFYWDLKHAVIDIVRARNSFMPAINFTYADKVVWTVRGVFRYFLEPREPYAAPAAHLQNERRQVATG
jgi:GT2 family glycosyltransferase